jgi:hypothetical protein
MCPTESIMIIVKVANKLTIYIFISETSFIRALSAALAAKFNIAPVRWQHPLHVAIVPPESKGKTEENDWDTACGISTLPFTAFANKTLSISEV